jgi:Sec20
MSDGPRDGTSAEIAEVEERISRGLEEILRKFSGSGETTFEIEEVFALNRRAQELRSSVKYLRFLLLSDPTTSIQHSADELRMHEHQLKDFERSVGGLCVQLETAVAEFEAEEREQKKAAERSVSENDISAAPEAKDGRTEGADEAQAPNAAVTNKSAIRQRLNHKTGSTASVATNSSAGSVVSSSATSLHRTRGLLASEIERMSSLGELLQADAASIAQTQAEHEAYSGEIEEAKIRIKKIKQRNAQDHKVILLAFAILCCVAAYAVSGRLLWIIGLKLP